jgi:hypothetical protein
MPAEQVEPIVLPVPDAMHPLRSDWLMAVHGLRARGSAELAGFPQRIGGQLRESCSRILQIALAQAPWSWPLGAR